MCNQLPSGSISTASQILGFAGEPGWLRAGVWVGSWAEHLLSPTDVRNGKILWHGALHSSFIRFGSAILTNTPDALRPGKGTFLTCHTALPMYHTCVVYFDCLKKKKKIRLCFPSSSCVHPLPLLRPLSLIFNACKFVPTSSCACQIYYENRGDVLTPIDCRMLLSLC